MAPFTRAKKVRKKVENLSLHTKTEVRVLWGDQQQPKTGVVASSLVMETRSTVILIASLRFLCGYSRKNFYVLTGERLLSWPVSKQIRSEGFAGFGHL